MEKRKEKLKNLTQISPNPILSESSSLSNESHDLSPNSLSSGLPRNDESANHSPYLRNQRQPQTYPQNEALNRFQVDDRQENDQQRNGSNQGRATDEIGESNDYRLHGGNYSQERAGNMQNHGQDVDIRQKDGYSQETVGYMPNQRQREDCNRQGTGNMHSNTFSQDQNGTHNLAYVRSASEKGNEQIEMAEFKSRQQPKQAQRRPLSRHSRDDNETGPGTTSHNDENISEPKSLRKAWGTPRHSLEGQQQQELRGNKHGRLKKERLEDTLDESLEDIIQVDNSDEEGPYEPFQRQPSRMSRRFKRMASGQSKNGENNNEDGQETQVEKIFSKQRAKDLQKRKKSSGFGDVSFELTAKKIWGRGIKEFVIDHKLWTKSMKRIEGGHGSGVLAFFRFLRWLLHLNLFISFSFIGFIFVPFLVGQFSNHKSNKYEALHRISPFGQSIFVEALYKSGRVHELIPNITEMTRCENSTYIVATENNDKREYFQTDNITAGNNIYKDWLNSTNSTNLPNCNSSRDFRVQAAECSYRYQTQSFLFEKNWKGKLLDVVEGTGWLSHTPIFLSAFYNISLPDPLSPNVHLKWDYGVAIVLTNLLVLGFCLVCIVLNSGANYQHSSRTKVKYKKYTMHLLCSWDYCIKEIEASDLKSAEVQRRILTDMRIDKERKDEKLRSRFDVCRINFLRILIWLSYIGVILLSFKILQIAVTEVTSESIAASSKKETEEASEEDFEKRIREFCIGFLPAVAVTLINIIFPIIYDILIFFESYHLEREIQIQLIRRVFLRLISVLILISSFYQNLVGCERDWCGNVEKSTNAIGNLTQESLKPESCDAISCWEQVIGGQFYKLVIVDFLSLFISSLIQVIKYFMSKCLKMLDTPVESPADETSLVKRLLRRFLSWSFPVLVPVFDIPVHVLDLMYSQVLCWLGMLFCPIIPLITCLKLVVGFYMKRTLVLRKIFQPNKKTLRADRTQHFFQLLLLVSFFLSTVLVLYTLSQIKPSKNCGPFRVYSQENYFMFDAVQNFVGSLGKKVTGILTIVFARYTAIVVVILFSLLWYYYKTLDAAYEAAEELLQEMNVREDEKCNVLLKRAKQFQRLESRSA